VHFLPIPGPAAKVMFGALRVVSKLIGGPMAELSNSTSILTKNNPFTSERAKRELGWNPTAHPSVEIPEAFRWWLTHLR
jgi:hypothetical protein